MCHPKLVCLFQIMFWTKYVVDLICSDLSKVFNTVAHVKSLPKMEKRMWRKNMLSIK